MGGNAANHQAILQHLEKVVSPANISPWDALDPPWQSQLQQAVTPDTPIVGIVSPENQQTLAEVISIAHQHQWRIIPAGAGSKLPWGGLARISGKEQSDASPLLVIRTQHLNHLIDHAIGDLTVTVEAGMSFASLQTTLAHAGQFLAIDPAYPDRATIGGIVATADTGSLRQRYNSIRDMLLGVTIVRADGQIAKAGGRVVKNVAGYDLMKLFTGSYGSLGIITQVTCRVYPLPASSQTVVFSGNSTDIAAVTAGLLRSALTPAAVDILAGQTIATSAHSSPVNLALAVRFQGIESSVKQQLEQTLQLGQTVGLVGNCATEVEENLWQEWQKHITLADQRPAIACKIGIRPSDAVTVLEKINTILPDSPWSGQVHAAIGLGRFVFAADLPPERLLQVRSLCQAHSGFLSILQAPVPLKQQIDVWGYPGNALDVMRRIKQQFDPQSRLSPHRFVGGI